MSNVQTYVVKVFISSEKDGKKVKKILCNINGVYDTHIDIEEGKVTIIGNPDLYIILKKLNKIGKHAELLTMNSMDLQQQQQQLNGQYDDAHPSDEYHHADVYPLTVTKYLYDEAAYSSTKYHHGAISSSDGYNHEAAQLPVGYHHEDAYPPVVTKYSREVAYTPIQYHQKTNYCKSSYIPTSQDEWESYNNMFNDENPNNKCSIM